MLQVNVLYVLQLHDSFLELFLFGIYVGDNCEYGSIAHVISTEDLHVHLQALLEKAQRVFVISCLHIAFPQERQNLGVILFSLFMLLEQGAIELQGSCQMIQCLFIVFIIKVSLTELGIRSDEDEEVLAVNVYEDLANGQLLNPNLDLSIKVLTHEEFIKLLILFNYNITMKDIRNSL